MTYKELLDGLSNLSVEQLAAPVRWWGDYRGGEIGELLILEEEYISRGDGMEPRSACVVEGDFAEGDVIAALDVGTVILLEGLPVPS